MEKKEDKNKEEVHEIYEIDKNEKKKIVETKGIIKEEKVKKKEISKENRVLRNILICIGIVLLIFIFVFFMRGSASKFKYGGMQFKAVTEGKLLFYRTSFPVLVNKTVDAYNLYFRNDPRKLKKEVPFNGTINLRNFLVLNTTTDNLFCNGDWNLAIGNMQNLKIFNIKVVKDENASCSPTGDYMFVQIEEGNQTKIEQYGPSCYKLTVHNCEILPVTERFMIDIIAKYKELSK
jgi:hypothetical protein